MADSIKGHMLDEVQQLELIPYLRPLRLRNPLKQKKQLFSELLSKLGVAQLAFVDGFYVRFNASSEPKGENDGD